MIGQCDASEEHSLLHSNFFLEFFQEATKELYTKKATHSPKTFKLTVKCLKITLKYQGM